MSDHDPEIRSAWSAASVDAPPPAVDAAIRAAARREVGAGPGRARSTHWWPLAAAATVAALAIGIVELTPPEQVASTPPASPPRRDALSGDELKKIAPGGDRNETNARKAEAATSVTSAPGALTQGPTRIVPPAKTEQPSRQRAGGVAQGEPIQAKQADDIARAARAPASPMSAATDAVRAQQAFPAAPAPPAESTAAAAPPPPMSRAAAVPPPAPPAMASRQGFAAAPARALENRFASDENAPSKPAPAVNALAAAPAQAAAAQSSAKAASTKDGPARPVDEWVALIRRLRAQGNVADAARELAAFHGAYKERAEALLPPDLRQPKP
jgi:hypothetical protein